jgi:mannonate dehydratase
MSAIAAVDTALWDIKAKAAGMPLYQLLGGASRERVMVYAMPTAATSRTVDEVLRTELGYKAIRAQSGVPGLTRSTASAPTARPTNRPPKGLPTEHGGTPASTCCTRPSCSTPCDRPSAGTTTCCTTCTTA